MKRFFLSRKTVLVLIGLIIGAVILSYVVPQRFSTASLTLEKWREAHPFITPLVDLAGLDHIYTTPWFSIILGLFLAALALSTVEQFTLARRKTFRPFLSPTENWQRVSLDGPQLEQSIRSLGYFKFSFGEETGRFVKHPWGYWGNVLLHLGMLLVIISSLLIVLTQKRGMLQLAEGEVYVPGNPWTVENKGILAGAFMLPEAVQLNRVAPEFWETDNLKQLSTSISFVSPQGRFTPYTLAINRILHYQGLRVYQSQSFGTVFLVELQDQEGRKNRLQLHIENPTARDKPGYGDFRFEGLPYLLRAKYLADADKQSMESTNPLLVMRLMEGERIVGETSLKPGESGMLGPYNARLAGFSRWAGLIFVDITGMSGIFLGFFIIVLGGGLTYFFPPREFLLRQEDEGFSVTWKAARFEEFYKGEYESVVGVSLNKVRHE